MGDFNLAGADWQEGDQHGRLAGMGEESMPKGLSREQFESWLEEIRLQPAWRAEADRESDYCDGNQLDSEVLRKQAAVGLPPAIEPLIGPVMDSVLGMEAQHRTDWRVIPDSDKDGDEVAEALNYKLNQAERKAKADKACSDAFASQAKVGLGWVEVSRDTNPFNYPYRTGAVHRNEIWWDWRSRLNMDVMRYLVRRKWTDKEQAKLLFPDHANLIELAAGGWSGWEANLTLDGGRSTGLSNRGDGIPAAYGAVTTPLAGQTGVSYPMLAASYVSERGSTLEEQEWRDTTNSRVCLFEVWYRVWERALVMKMPDGRVVEYDDDNMTHLMLVATQAVQPTWTIISRVRLSWWLGPHKLSDEPSPYRHRHFPYVPFICKLEDRTGVPFGMVRGMMYLQDNVNASMSKIRWSLSAVRTERTDGATVDDDDTVRREVARPDADIKLVKDFVAKQHVFKVTRDFQLNQQQYQMLIDSREGIKRVGGIQNAFMGNETGAKSGVAITSLAEQSTQSLADLYDNFRDARSMVGELLLSMIVQDMIGKEEVVVIRGGALNEDREIRLNVPARDEESGIEYLDNDVERTMLKVTMEDVPSTPSFRSQQLMAFSEVFKAAPPEFQAVLFPQLLSLMDVPNRDDAIKAVREAMKNMTPEQIEARIQQEVQAALVKANVEIKAEELKQKAKLTEAQVKEITARAVKVGTEAAFAAMQAGQAIATMPAIAPIADVVMQGAGYKVPSPAGDDPNFPQPTGAPAPAMDVHENTSPQLPPVPASPMEGVETLRNENANQ